MDAVEAMRELGGVATRRELERLTSRKRLRRAVLGGDLVQAGRGRFALAGTDEAVLAAGRVSGVVSHLSAALLWGWKVQDLPGRPHVTVPRKRTLGDRAEGIRVHWADLGPDDVVDGRTSRLRTVVDCARTLPFPAALAVADSALREARISRAHLLAEAGAAPRTGRPAALRVAEAADQRADNPFESALRAVCLEVPGLAVRPQYRIEGVGRADLVDPRLGLVLEAESLEFHGDRAGFDRDVRRYTDMVRAGWTVVRFTWPEVMHRPERVHDVLVDMVARGPDPRAVRPVQLPRAA